MMKVISFVWCTGGDGASHCTAGAQALPFDGAYGGSASTGVSALSAPDGATFLPLHEDAVVLSPQLEAEEVRFTRGLTSKRQRCLARFG